ncbi:9242_t:CDS:1, partial [Ambispora leptoticha]
MRNGGIVRRLKSHLSSRRRFPSGVFMTFRTRCLHIKKRLPTKEQQLQTQDETLVKYKPS